MAFGLKYELLCTSRKGNLYKTKILFDGYTGDDIDRDVPISPFKLRKDKAAVVRGTSFEFSIREQVDFEFLEFYTNNSKKIKIELYDPSNTLIWTGYNLPQQYQVPYVPPPTPVAFTATDGLGLLKTESFGLTGRKSQMEIICYCIDKIGLGLGYSIAINLWEENHNQLRSPLEQTYENTENFSELKCYAVLEMILNKYNAEITQRRGRWAITRMADKKSTRMLYTSAGVYSTTEAGPAVLNLGQKGGTEVDVWPRGILQMGVEPGAKQVKIIHEYGRKNSLFSNCAFDWSIDGDFTPEHRFNDNGAYAFLPGRSDTEEFIYETKSLVNAPGEDFVFSVKSAAVGSKLYGGIPIPVLMSVTLKVVLTNGEDTMYLLEDGTWTESNTSITKKTSSTIGGEPRFNSLQIIAKEIPFDGDLTVSLGRYHSMHEVNDSGWTVEGIAWADMNCYFVKDGQLYASGSNSLVSFVESTEPGVLPDITLLTADAPDLPNANIYFKNITYLQDGTITTKWPLLPLWNMLALDLASDNRCCKQKLSGEIRGNGIAFDSIIKHPYNNNREFEILEGAWDIFEEVFNVTLLELLAWSDEVIEIITASGTAQGSESSAGAGSINSVVIGDVYGALSKWFEVVNAETEDEYLRCKLPFGGDFEISAWADSGQLPSIWESLPVATATILGGVKIGTGLTIDENGILNATAGGGGGGGDGVWGEITGTLGDQSDLASALAAKATLASPTFTGTPVLPVNFKIGSVAMTATASELNVLDGITASTAELNYTDGVTSNIQTQLNLKAPLASPTFTGTVSGVTAAMVGLGNVTNESKATMFTAPTFTGIVSASGSIKVNTINEYTTANGVTIDGVLLKDSKMAWSYLSGVPTTRTGYGITDMPNFTGTPVAEQLAIWTSTTNTLKGSAKVTFIESTNTFRIDGNIIATGEISAFQDTDPGNDFWQWMPVATATTLGGVKVGTGLSITNGILSATGSVGFNEAGNYSPTGTWDFTQTPTVGGVAVSLSNHTHYTAAALTKTNDTNVTLTLGGTPTAALLQTVSLTLGWTGTLADSRIASASTWNAKQSALSGTGLVKSTAGTISYITDNSTTWNALVSFPGFGTSHVTAAYGDHTHAYQPVHANLTSLAGLTYSEASFVKMTAAGTFALDTTSYASLAAATFTGQITLMYKSPRFELRSTLTGTRRWRVDVDDANSMIKYTSTYGTVSAFPHVFYLGGTEYFRIASTGITVNGTITATGYNSTNWNSAYGWGDHAAAGYAPIASPTFTGTPVLPLNFKIGTVAMTATATELNVLDGITASTSELNYTDGVTSNIQTQLNTKAPVDSPTFTGTVGGVTATMVGLGNVTNESKATMFSSPVFTTKATVPVLYGSSAANGDLTLRGTSNATLATSYVILADVAGAGGVLIGTTTMTSGFYFDVTGNTHITGDISITGNYLGGGEVTAYSSSDLFLKKNIREFTGLDLVDKMRPVCFKWNDTAKKLNKQKDNRKNYGVIAQELEAIMPELIHPIYEKYKAVDYIQLVPVLIAAIQELREEVKQLRK